MIAPDAFRLLGAHRHEALSARHGEDFFDAIDLLLHAGAERTAVLGIRTVGYMDSLDRLEAADGARPDPVRPEVWNDGYVPLAISLDRSTITFWDFDHVLWVGPAEWPCLAWSNAAAISLTGVRFMLRRARPGGVLAGPDGRGLPTPDDVGFRLSSWRDLPVLSLDAPTQP